MQLILNNTHRETGNDLLSSLYKQGSCLNHSSRTILNLKDSYVRRLVAQAIENGLSNYSVALLISRIFEYNTDLGNTFIRALPVVEASKLRHDVSQCFHVGTKKLTASLSWENDVASVR